MADHASNPFLPEPTIVTLDGVTTDHSPVIKELYIDSEGKRFIAFTQYGTASATATGNVAAESFDGEVAINYGLKWEDRKFVGTDWSEDSYGAIVMDHLDSVLTAAAIKYDWAEVSPVA